MVKTKKRIIALLVVVAIACTVVIGTVAYLTDSSTATNTFTVGDVKIKLDEAKVDEYGAVEGAERVTANTYKLIPGQTYTKDPTTTVLKDSEPCYVRCNVKVTGLDKLMAAIPADKYPEYYKTEGGKTVFLLQKLVSGWDKEIWDTQWDYGFDAETSTYQFRYIGTKATDGKVDGRTADVVLEPLFTSFTLPAFIDSDTLKTLKDLKFDVTSDAIQGAGFSTAADAWAAFDAQVSK